jgi:hypothetical protein
VTLYSAYVSTSVTLYSAYVSTSVTLYSAYVSTSVTLYSASTVLYLSVQSCVQSYNTWKGEGILQN